jgi:hypothetical protein
MGRSFSMWTRSPAQRHGRSLTAHSRHSRGMLSWLSHNVDESATFR